MDASEIKWKRHEYHTFYAKMKIRLGDKNTSYTLDKGDEFDFDGTMCKYAGAEFSQPSLRGAILNGWASLDENDNRRVQPRVAVRNVAKATSINRDLSKVQLQDPDSMETGDADEDTVLEIGDRRAALEDRRHLTTADNRRKPRVAGLRVEEGIEDQEAIVVSRIKTPARRSVDVAAQPNKAREIEMSTSYDAGFGRSRQVEGIDIKMNVGSVRGTVPVSEGIDDEGEVVGKVRQSAKIRSVEGISITDTSNIRNPPKVRRVDPAPAPSPAEASSDPKHKLSVAQSIYSKFPADWNFFAKSEDKLARIEQLGANKTLIQALMASESKTMRKVLAERYPKLQTGRTG